MSAVLITLSVITLLISAFLSASEAAAFALGTPRIRTLMEEGFRGARALWKVRDRAPTVRATIFVLITLSNLLCVGIVVATAMARWGWVGAAPALPVTAVGVLFLGEVMPRALGARRPILIALNTASILLAIERLFRPLLNPVARLGNLLARIDGGEEATLEEREVRELTDLGEREGVVEVVERQLVERAFRLDELTAWDVMRPRVEIFAWRDSLTLEEIVGELEDVPYSRVPVYADTIDDVTGILYVREAYRAFVAGRGSVRLRDIARDPFFVPGSVSLTRLLNDFQVRRLHMGIVADEFGGTDGLVTLEDVIEELVGEIEDETDIREEPLVRVSRHEVVAAGSVDLREVNYALNVSLPLLESRSLNGLLLDELGRVPEEGEKVEIANLSIEILAATETQVLRARLKPLQPPAEGRER